MSLLALESESLHPVHHLCRISNKIMIAQIMRDSPADIDGRLKVGDQILEINDTPVDCLTNEEVKELLHRSTGPFLSLLVLREAKTFTNQDYFLHPKYLR
ncbi:gamma-2-syntrophin-like isoform X2 [Convolutriloba macropyga]|uniref:gamma-2-syntrophin-like isoform X2 n=1 Tax=Convolutriloba macropyga TaxID=536237 RepID=UPI003F527A5F